STFGRTWLTKRLARVLAAMASVRVATGPLAKNVTVAVAVVAFGLKSRSQVSKGSAVDPSAKNHVVWSSGARTGASVAAAAAAPGVTTKTRSTTRVRNRRNRRRRRRSPHQASRGLRRTRARPNPACQKRPGQDAIPLYQGLAVREAKSGPVSKLQ